MGDIKNKNSQKLVKIICKSHNIDILRNDDNFQDRWKSKMMILASPFILKIHYTNVNLVHFLLSIFYHLMFMSII